MNTYKFEDLNVGDEEKFSVQITPLMMKQFLSITGDTNPLHTEKEFSKQNNFKDCVVYGMLTASFISTLAGVYLPGKYCLIQSVESKFIKPVFEGDVITISGIVERMHESVQQIEIKVLMINQYNEKVLRGKLKVGFLNE